MPQLSMFQQQTHSEGHVSQDLKLPVTPPHAVQQDSTAIYCSLPQHNPSPHLQNVSTRLETTPLKSRIRDRTLRSSPTEDIWLTSNSFNNSIIPHNMKQKAMFLYLNVLQSTELIGAHREESCSCSPEGVTR